MTTLTRVPPDLLTIPTAADRLGISRSNALRLAKLGKLPGAFKIGSRWRVSVPRLERFMHGGDILVPAETVSRPGDSRGEADPTTFPVDLSPAPNPATEAPPPSPPSPVARPAPSAQGDSPGGATARAGGRSRARRGARAGAT